jgi:hypothetical protein
MSDHFTGREEACKNDYNRAPVSIYLAYTLNMDILFT